MESLNQKSEEMLSSIPSNIVPLSICLKGLFITKEFLTLMFCCNATFFYGEVLLSTKYIFWLFGNIERGVTI